MKSFGPKLTTEDARAIDLLLNHGNAKHAGMATMAAAVSSQHLRSAENVLNLLSQLPDEEPPAGLIERTLERIDSAFAPHLSAPPVAVNRDDAPMA